MNSSERVIAIAAQLYDQRRRIRTYLCNVFNGYAFKPGKYGVTADRDGIHPARDLLAAETAGCKA